MEPTTDDIGPKLWSLRLPLSTYIYTDVYIYIYIYARYQNHPPVSLMLQDPFTQNLSVFWDGWGASLRSARMAGRVASFFDYPVATRERFGTRGTHIPYPFPMKSY